MLRGPLGTGTTAKQQSQRLGLSRTILRVGTIHRTGRLSFSAATPQTECWTQPKRALGRWAHESSPYVIKLTTKQKVPEKPK